MVLVEEPEHLTPALERIDEPVIGIDVERADSNNYFRRSALIQIGTADVCVLIDTVALEGFGEIDAFLEDRLGILHAAQNDLIPLDSDGILVPNLGDTAVAAGLLGLPIGLGPLLSELLDVELSPDKDRFQRADWGARPIDHDMLAYAADDVYHLPRLHDHLLELLDDAGRLAWYEQEIAHLKITAMSEVREWTKVRGSGRLNPAQRALLRTLWEQREELAREHDIAPNRLLRDDVLLDLSTTPSRGPADIIRRQQRRNSPIRHHGEAMHEAALRGAEAPPEPKRSKGKRRASDEDRAAFDAMKSARTRIAKELGLDPGTMCSSKLLQPAAHGNPTDRDQLCELAQLRPWQAELLGDALWDAWANAHDGNDDSSSDSSDEE